MAYMLHCAWNMRKDMVYSSENQGQNVLQRPSWTQSISFLEGTFARRVPGIQISVPAIYPNALPPNITPKIPKHK